MFSNELRSEHRGSDDLLTAGLGLAGLRSMAPPPFADASAPTVDELRRRAMWGSWRGIADLAPGGGYGELFGSLQSVPGQEYSAFARLPGAPALSVGLQPGVGVAGTAGLADHGLGLEQPGSHARSKTTRAGRV